MSTLSTSCLRASASFPAVVAAVMEAAAQYTDMSGLQKRALVKAAMEEIVRHHVPSFEPFLPLAEPLCDNMVQAARQAFRFRAPHGAALCCCRRRRPPVPSVTWP